MSVRNRLARAVSARKAQAAPLYFVHIMKTGGTALTSALARLNDEAGRGPSVTELFLDQFVARDAREWEQVGFVTGHLPWEARARLPERTRTLTVLRDPVDRTLSHYWQLSINPDVQAESPSFSLDEFVDSPRWNTLCIDYQARQLAHHIDLANAGTGWSPAERFASLGPPFPLEHQYPLQSLFDCSPLSLTGTELQEAALAALADIELVGVTEQLDSLYADVALRVFGVADPPPLGRENRSEDRPRRPDLAPELLQRIEAMTAVDRVLYEAARARGPIREE